MEFTELTKFFFGLIASLGTIAVTYFNMGQAKKINAELLTMFEAAVQKEQKHSVTELFRLIHGLRMNYQDIMTLIQDDQCSKIIYALKKTPGIVSYENGKFKYSGLASSKLFMFFDRAVTKFGLWFFSSLVLCSMALLVFGSDHIALIGLILTFPASVLLGMQLKRNKYDKMISDLVNQ